MFQIVQLPEEPTGFVNVSTSNEWTAWIGASLPDGLDQDVRARLISNLKHIIVGLELKAALVTAHANRGANPARLFEPYLHNLNFEFCVGAFSVCEGLGSALWLRNNGRDGSAGERVGPRQWKPELIAKFDPGKGLNLQADVDSLNEVRDKLHQDQLGARASIDWHAFAFDRAFVPA